MEFNSWTEMKEHIETLNIGLPFNGCGIFQNKIGTIFLRSVDGTDFYNDAFDPIRYTLYGQVGDQKLDDKYNRHIVTGNIAYLYRVHGKKHTWYGMMRMGAITEMEHPDKYGDLRLIYRVRLTPV